MKQKRLFRTSLYQFALLVSVIWFGGCRREKQIPPIDGYWHITNFTTGDAYDWQHLDNNGERFLPGQIHNVCDWLLYQHVKHPDSAAFLIQIVDGQLRWYTRSTHNQDRNHLQATIPFELKRVPGQQDTYRLLTPTLAKAHPAGRQDDNSCHAYVEVTLESGAPSSLWLSGDGVTFALEGSEDE